jgi:hypothetical protein
MEDDEQDGSNDKWLVQLVPCFPQNVQSDISMGTIPLLVSAHSSFEHVETSVIIGRVDIIKSVSAACKEPLILRQWLKYGGRYLNKNMLQFTVRSCLEPPAHSSHKSKQQCFVQSCGKNVLPTIFLNGQMALSHHSNSSVELQDNDELRFIVPCIGDSFLEVSYRIVFRYVPAQVQPLMDHSSCESTESEDDKSSMLSLYHFSHSYETFQSLSLTSPKRCIESSSKNNNDNNNNSLNQPTSDESVCLSSLSTHQLQTLTRNEYNLTVSNESLRVATTEQQDGKHKFLNAILTLTTLAVNKKHDGSTRTMAEEETSSRELQKPWVFPHLLTNVTVDKSLFHDLQIKDRRNS